MEENTNEAKIGLLQQVAAEGMELVAFGDAWPSYMSFASICSSRHFFPYVALYCLR